jgi:hypothetical protein
VVNPITIRSRPRRPLIILEEYVTFQKLFLFGLHVYRNLLFFLSRNIAVILKSYNHNFIRSINCDNFYHESNGQQPTGIIVNYGRSMTMQCVQYKCMLLPFCHMVFVKLR